MCVRACGRARINNLFLILGWWYHPDRVQTGGCLLVCIMLASLPLFVGVLSAYNYVRCLCLFILRGYDFLSGGLFYVCVTFASF